MRPSRVLTGAALSAAALGLSTTAAFAGDFGTIEVSPGTAKAGFTVNLTSSACGRHGSARVDASSLGAGTVRLAPKGRTHSENVQGSLRIPSGTQPGNYGIGGTCSDGREITGTVGIGKTIGKSSTRGGTTGSTMAGSSAGKESGSATPAPQGKVKTGVGTTTESSSGTEVAAGAALLMAAVAGGIRVMRRRREGGRS
ncbi:hypothetical protein AB0I10_23345 [Streptomyces sp. NPDC050636]|uniref:hypothetical protein n=1 Tax=Streptomyces sp. NPDC050636 TaxID=3154510 RepID=UPI003444CF85